MGNQVETNKLINTSRIRLFIDIPFEEGEKRKETYRKLYDWREIAFKAANQTVTNLYVQDQIKELFYFHDDVRIKLADRKVDSQGILNCSRENTTYRVLSKKYKNEIPASIFSCINRSVNKFYANEKSQYFSGDRSLRNYKSNIPIPFVAKSIFDLRFDSEIKNFRFSLFKDEKYHIPFKTYLGKDKSGNKAIIEKCIDKTYHLCISAIQIRKNIKTKKDEIYLILTIEIPRKKVQVNHENLAKVKLSFLAPLIIEYNGKEYLIGDKESFVYKRLAIQQGLKRRQQKMKYNKGGRGINNKTKGVKESKAKEKNFIETFMHQISSELIKFCLKNEIGRLEIDNISQSIEEAQEFPFVIRNWSYGNLMNKLEYKSNLNNIELIYN